MSDAPIKTFILRGNLQKLTKDEFLYYRFANNECRMGLWKICVLNVGYHITSAVPVSQISEFVQISSNFVKDHRFVNSGNESYSVALCDFLMKGPKNERKLIQFDKTWYYVNCGGDELRLYFRNSMNGEQLPSTDINIFVTILLQQVR
jgi:hypothetical protein